MDDQYISQIVFPQIQGRCSDFLSWHSLAILEAVPQYSKLACPRHQWTCEHTKRIFAMIYCSYNFENSNGRPWCTQPNRLDCPKTAIRKSDWSVEYISSIAKIIFV